MFGDWFFWYFSVNLFLMAETNNIDASSDCKVRVTFFLYGSPGKLDGNNYEIWCRLFLMLVAGHD